MNTVVLPKATIHKIILAILCAGIAVSFAYRHFTAATLEVENAQGQVLLSIPLAQEQTFSLRFIHSVHKTPVWENFIVKQWNQMILTSTEYQSYGVGMPSLPSEGTFIQKKDRFVLTDLHRKFVQIPVRVGPEAQLTLLSQGKEYPLYKSAEPGTLLTIRCGIKLFGIIDIWPFMQKGS